MQFNRPTINFSYKSSPMHLKLLFINLAVFVSIVLLNIPFFFMNEGEAVSRFMSRWFAVPADLGNLLTKPWTLISYMFLHTGFSHLLSNMLLLYFLGQIFVQFLGERKLLTVYIAGGIAGALAYILFFNIFPVYKPILSSSIALGASASVMAIIVAIGTYTPQTKINLLFLGPISLKFIVLVLFILDLVGIPKANSGGHLAHLGGAALGFIFAKQWLKGNDITKWAGTFIDFITAVFNPPKKRKMKVKYKSEATKNYDYNARKKDEQAEIDAILDKISKSGYDSLSKKEKEILFKASEK